MERLGWKHKEFQFCHAEFLSSLWISVSSEPAIQSLPNLQSTWRSTPKMKLRFGISGLLVKMKGQSRGFQEVLYCGSCEGGMPAERPQMLRSVMAILKLPLAFSEVALRENTHLARMLLPALTQEEKHSRINLLSEHGRKHRKILFQREMGSFLPTLCDPECLEQRSCREVHFLISSRRWAFVEDKTSDSRELVDPATMVLAHFTC